jgi:hypothetical protein
MTVSYTINIDIAQRDGFHKKKDQRSLSRSSMYFLKKAKWAEKR